MWIKSNKQMLFINLDNVQSIKTLYENEFNEVLGGRKESHGIIFICTNNTYKYYTKSSKEKYEIIDLIFAMLESGKTIFNLDDIDTPSNKNYPEPIIKKI